MSARVSFKNSSLMLLAGLVCAVGTAILIIFMLSGPKLGTHFDILSGKKNPAVSRDILIVNTGEYVEGSDFFIVLMTLTEMNASNLILTSRISPSSSPITVTDVEIRRRFIDEYQIVGSNIRNLFEGIRLGSVSPVDAPHLVDRLVELTEQGRDRLITTLIDRDEDMIRSVSVFGSFLESYAKVQLDEDGKLRRVSPVEHPVYEYLKNRYAASYFESVNGEHFLHLRAHDGNEIDITLDRGSNIITVFGNSIRRIDIELFREYGEKNDAMLLALMTANEAGAFSQTAPENIPLFLGEYSASLLEELVKMPNDDNRIAWIASRDEYFSKLESYFKSEVDLKMINDYEERIADTDPSNERELVRLVGARDAISEVSLLMRRIYADLFIAHLKLKEELSSSFCVMGYEENAEYSALLANALITGSHVKPVSARYSFLFSIAVSFVILLIVFMMRPLLIVILGCALSFLSTAAASALFVYNSIWLDPVVILSSSLVGILIVFFCKSAYLNYRAINFRAAYKSAVPKNILQGLINTGRPALNDVNVAYASVIAIKDNNMFGREDGEKSKDSGRIKRNFYTMVKRAVFSAGGVIAGYEGDIILACFGSPLELKPTLVTYKYTEDGQPVGTYNPIEKACALVSGLLKNEKINWRFGIDAGECSFSWSSEAGFCVSGRPAVRARMLVSKTARLKVRALITNLIREKIALEEKKLGGLYEANDWFFEFNQ
ncbi:MAG: hypothetical protein FWC01_04175 [Treponema sp.]|nr:hypothetical protein [Treponema sp.]MCL2237109.1 hypothetical protein [Treponema sp.]